MQSVQISLRSVVLIAILAVAPSQACAQAFTTIDVPGFCCTFAQGINDNGQIVGWVGFPASPEMAFVATPVAAPEPSGLLTLPACLLALFGIALHRGRADAGIVRPANVYDGYSSFVKTLF